MQQLEGLQYATALDLNNGLLYYKALPRYPRNYNDCYLILEIQI